MLATQFHSHRLDNYNISNPVYRHHHITAFHQLNEWLEQTGFVTGITNFLQQESDNQIVLKFRLAEKYESHFIWIRGFISLGNHFKILADRQQRTFSLTLNSSDMEGFRTYLEKVFNVLQNELIFRAELKQLIKLNARYTRLENAIRNK